MCFGVETFRVGVPFPAALGWLYRLGRVSALLPGLGALPVGDVRGMELEGCEVFGLGPRQRPAMFTPDSGARR